MNVAMFMPNRISPRRHHYIQTLHGERLRTPEELNDYRVCSMQLYVRGMISAATVLEVNDFNSNQDDVADSLAAAITVCKYKEPYVFPTPMLLIK